MKIDIQFDSRNLKALTLREKKNLAYSTSQALNETAKDMQQKTRIRMDRIFHLRKAGFMYRMIKIFKFSNARQGIAYAEIGVQQRPVDRRNKGPFSGLLSIHATPRLLIKGNMSTSLDFQMRFYYRFDLSNGEFCRPLPLQPAFTCCMTVMIPNC